MQGGGAVIQPDAMPDADVRSKVRLEAFDGGAEDELGFGHHRREGRLEFGPDRAILGLEVEEGDAHGGSVAGVASRLGPNSFPARKP